MTSTQSVPHDEREVVLVAYATSYDPVEKIATRIADDLAEEGQEAELWRVGANPPSAPIDSYEGIVIGGPIFSGGHPHVLRQFIRANLEALREIPTAFFAVSVGLQKERSEEREEVRSLEHRLFDEAGWSPGMHLEFADPANLNWREVARFARCYLCELSRGGHRPETPVADTLTHAH